MRPLPTSPDDMPPAPFKRTLELGSPAAANQRRGGCTTQRAYPWLLVVATLMAAVFCGLYLTKPVIVNDARSGGGPAVASLPGIKAPSAAPQRSELPSDLSALPGDEASRPAAVEPRNLSPLGEATFEETNLRIQHILNARGPADEDLGKIVLDVPVLYRSGSLRWSAGDVAKARALLLRLDEYQTKSSSLRADAEALLSDWDNLIYASIPESSLRADSPSLPENQGMGTAGDATLNTTRSIEIKTR